MTQARAIVVGLAALVLAAYAMQFFIDFSSENLAAASIVLVSSLTVLLYILWTGAIQTNPLSTFAIFGFCTTTQLGALLAQSAAWTPIVQNLRQPVDTFATLFFYQSIALCAHSLYRIISNRNSKSQPKVGLIRASLEKLGLYDTPSVGTLWVMGLGGLFSFAFSGGEGVISKIAHGFTFVAWAPFLIPMYILQNGSAYCNPKKNYTFLALYAGSIAVLAVSVNARGMMLAGLMTIALFVVLHTMLSHQKVKVAQIWKLGLAVVVLATLAIPMDYMVTAMVLARNTRDKATAIKMVEETWYYIKQPRLLEIEKERTKFISVQSNYDETYFASPLVGRLVETKFHDNALYFGSRLNEQDKDRLQTITGDFFWGALPEPLLKFLKIDVDKKALNFSMGDYLSHLAGAGDLGGFKTGSGFAQGMAIFGYAFPVIYFCVCIVLFLCIDLLTSRKEQTGTLVTALGMLGIWRMFQYGISAESLHYLFIAVVRGVPQAIALYLLFYHLSRIGAATLGKLAGHKAPPGIKLVA